MLYSLGNLEQFSNCWTERIPLPIKWQWSIQGCLYLFTNHWWIRNWSSHRYFVISICSKLTYLLWLNSKCWFDSRWKMHKEIMSTFNERLRKKLGEVYKSEWEYVYRSVWWNKLGSSHWIYGLNRSVFDPSTKGKLCQTRIQNSC